MANKPISGLDAVVTPALTDEIAINQAGVSKKLTAAQLKTLIHNAGSPARNVVQNVDPLSQGESSRAGMSATIYTGNGASNPVTTGVDGDTGDFGALVWIKERDGIDSHQLFDTVRGVQNSLFSDVTGVEASSANYLTSFDSAGFTVGLGGGINANTSLYVAWSWQTTKKVTGVTNRNKAYTAHFNPDMNFSIVGYVGDGVNGHEIPHHLGVVPELTIFKNRDTVENWLVKSSLFQNDELLLLNTSAALSANASYDFQITDTTISIGTQDDHNKSADNIVAYNFASKPGVCKIGKYIGKGSPGKYVECGFKPAFVMAKNLNGTDSWVIVDSIRADKYLFPDQNAAEGAAAVFDFEDNGFTVVTAGTGQNELNSEYIFMAFAETSLDGTKAVTNYPYATTADTVSVTEDTLISVANGFDANGQLDTLYQFGAGITKAYGAGHESKHYYMYTDEAGVLGETEVKPLIGIARPDADKYGLVSPVDALTINANSRTTDQHYDYESASGVALASGELNANYAAHYAFNKDRNDLVDAAFVAWVVTSSTNSWLQYKHAEKRILKSWRLRESGSVGREPQRFTIEGSNDGFNWVAVDSTYTGSNYTGNGIHLWGDLQSTTANVTPYLYHRINITANGTDATYTAIAELELNTVTLADYYLIEEGQMYDSSDVAQERVYLGEFKTDADGDIINETIINYAPSSQDFNEVVVHEDLTVHGDINNRQACTAWVKFDLQISPPLIHDSFNVKDVVDVALGGAKIIFETPMDDEGYSTVLSTDNSTSGEWIDETTKNDFKAWSHDGSVYVDNIVMVQVFGGKKIK